MSKKMKISICLVMIVVLLFGIYNVVWYRVIHNKYDPFTRGMQEFRPRVSYVLPGEDGYAYVTVKLYPCSHPASRRAKIMVGR